MNAKEKNIKRYKSGLLKMALQMELAAGEIRRAAEKLDGALVRLSLSVLMKEEDHAVIPENERQALDGQMQSNEPKTKNESHTDTQDSRG